MHLLVEEPVPLAWGTDIARRIAAIELGQMQLESWDEVKQRVAKDVLGR